MANFFSLIDLHFQDGLNDISHTPLPHASLGYPPDGDYRYYNIDMLIYSYSYRPIAIAIVAVLVKH